MVIPMKIYLDLVLFINFFFDFILLFGVNTLLKKRAKLYRLILSSIFGSISILFLFIPINNISLFILKLIISIIMILIAFGDKNFKKTYVYFYILSIFLGGVMYLLNDTFSYKNKGIVFFSNGLSINLIVMIIISPIVIYYYVKENKEYKNMSSNTYLIDIYIGDTRYSLTGYLDTGNTLKDPYKKRPVIITDSTKIDFNIEKCILVPYETISNKGIIKCIKPDKVIINKKEFKNCLIGKVNKEIKLNDSDCILPNKFKEDLC